jgi:iron complex outermembrane receptor protein
MGYKNQLVLTGQVNDVGAYTRTNIAKSYRTGIELEGNFQLTEKIRFNNNLALSQNKILDYTDYMDDYDNGGQKTTFYKKADIGFSPNVVGSSVLSYSVAKGFELDLVSKYVSRQYLDNTSRADRSLSAYFLQDLKLNYQFKLGKSCKATWLFQLNNIWNKLYTPNGYTYSYNYYYPMAGTNYMMGLNLHF